MKWSPTGWGAEIKNEGGQVLRVVEKWSDEGDALVGDESGRLVVAAKLSGFQRLVQLHRVIGIIPAATGWRVNAHTFGPYPGFISPIAAWVVDGEGNFWPVIGLTEPEGGGQAQPSDDGDVIMKARLSSRYRIIGPDRE